jgi:N-acetylneuraminic acid mutarotase
MEALAALPVSEATLLGQSALMGSMLDHVAALNSNTDFTSVLNVIRATASRGTFKVGLEKLPTTGTELKHNLDIGFDSRSSFLNQVLDVAKFVSSNAAEAASVSRLFVRQLHHYRHNPLKASGPEVKTAPGINNSSVQDPLTGITEGATLVGSGDIKINFQPSTSTVPNGYIKDVGEAYHDTRGYGWVQEGTNTPRDITLYARDRNRVGIAPGLNTLLHMQYRNTPAAAWEYKLPNGTYKVTVSVGDQPKYDSQHTINVEGVTAINDFQGSATQEYKKAIALAKVSDGKLTIDAIGGSNTKINYIHIVSSFAQINWSTVAPSPIGRSEALGATVDGKLYVFGGYTDTTYTPTRRADVYDPLSNRWTHIKHMPKGLTHTGTAVDEVNNDIYLAGGYIEQADGSGQTFGTKNVWKYDVETDTWTHMPSLPQARASGELSLLHGKLHFFGGTNIKRTQDMGNHWVLSLNGGTNWTSAAPLPNPRTHMGDAVIGGKIYAIGGQHGHDHNLVTQDSVHAWNPGANTWTAVRSLPKALSHISSSTFVMDGRVIVAGGETYHGSKGTVADVMAYDPVFNSWTALTSLPAPRRSGVASSIGNQIFYTTGSPGFSKTTYKGMH